MALAGSVLAKPSELVAVAESAGITPAAFEHEDLRVIYCAADVARDRPIVDVLWLARRQLQLLHFWDAEGIGSASRWSDETLASLAQSWPASAAAVRANAR